MIRFSCPSCDTKMMAPEDKAGCKCSCITCKQRLQVPGAKTETTKTVLGKLETMPVVSSMPVEKLPELMPIPTGKAVQPARSGIRCPECGSQVPAKATRCRYCGCRFEDDDDFDFDRRSRRREREPERVDVRQNVLINVDGGNRSSFPHGLHIVLTIFTCGAWFPIWIIHFIIWSAS